MEKSILERAKKYVNTLLLPLEDHYYHQYEHALDVMDRAIYLGEKEGLSDEEIEMLGIAGIFHDTGFIIQYDKNEVIGAKIAKNFLKAALYPEESIQQVEELILATDPEYKTPKNLLEQIIKDADLDNLGRDDFFTKGVKLKQEIESIKKIKIKEPNWHHSSLDLLFEHKYYTNTQKNERLPGKNNNTSRLKEMLSELEAEENIKLEDYL